MIDCTRVADLGEAFSPGLYQVKVDYLIRHEFARSAQDIVWRRTCQGIGMNTLQIDRLAEYIDMCFRHGYCTGGGIKCKLTYLALTRVQPVHERS